MPTTLSVANRSPLGQEAGAARAAPVRAAPPPNPPARRGSQRAPGQKAAVVEEFDDPPYQPTARTHPSVQPSAPRDKTSVPGPASASGGGLKLDGRSRSRGSLYPPDDQDGYFSGAPSGAHFGGPGGVQEGRGTGKKGPRDGRRHVNAIPGPSRGYEEPAPRWEGEGERLAKRMRPQDDVPQHQQGVRLDGQPRDRVVVREELRAQRAPSNLRGVSLNKTINKYVAIVGAFQSQFALALELD